jgi:hypothetical protein
MNTEAFRRNDWVEKFTESGQSLGFAYVDRIAADGTPVVVHEAKPAEWPASRLRLVRRSQSAPIAVERK